MFKIPGSNYINSTYRCQCNNRLAKECAKLDPEYEQKMAEEGFSSEIEKWPEYKTEE